MSDICEEVSNMTLQQKAVKEISILSDEDLSQVMQFISFLRFSKTEHVSMAAQESDHKKYRTRGGLRGKVILADDFDETPDCFKEYL